MILRDTLKRKIKSDSNEYYSDEHVSLIDLLCKLYKDNLIHKKTILFIDFNLIDIRDWNANLKPLFTQDKYKTSDVKENEIFLPDNITLCYASSDVGKENIMNQLISYCDKEANKNV